MQACEVWGSYRGKDPSCDIYVTQPDTECFVIKFIHNIWWLDMFRTSMVHPQERFTGYMLQIWYVVICVLLDTSRCYVVVGRTAFFIVP